MRRPSRNATPARGPADPISPAPRLLPPLWAPPGGASSSGPGGIGRVGFSAEGDGLLALAVLGAAALASWRRRSSGEFAPAMGQGYGMAQVRGDAASAMSGQHSEHGSAWMKDLGRIRSCKYQENKLTSLSRVHPHARNRERRLNLSGYLYPSFSFDSRIATEHTPSLPPILLHDHYHAELAEVPGRHGGPERLRLAHHRRGGHGRRRRPEPYHRHRHGRHVGDRGGDGAGAGQARRQAGPPGKKPQGGRGRPRAPPRRARPRHGRRPRRGAAARPLLPRLRPPLRQALPRPPPPAQPPHKQRGAVRGPVGGVGGRGGDDVRHQLPGPLPAHQAAAGQDGGDGEGHRRPGPRRKRLLHRPHLVRRRRRPLRLPPPRHPQDHAVRSDEGLCALQARQRASHQGTRRTTQGDGRQRDGELRPPWDCQDTPHPRPCRPRHQHSVLPGIQAPQDGPSGGRNDMLRGGAPGGVGGVGEVLRGLQRGVAVKAGVQLQGGLQAVELLREHHRREGEAGRCPSHKLQAPGSELQRRPRHGYRLGGVAPEILISLAANSFKRPVTRNLDDSFRNCYG